jgi:hypothetical protein
MLPESRFTEDPATIDRIAGSIGRELPRHDRDRIFEESRRENVEKLISNLEQLPGARRAGEDLFDLDTQWHKLHAGRTGEVGKWRRTLSEGQIARIEARLHDRMANLDYKPTRSPDEIHPSHRLTIPARSIFQDNTTPSGHALQT